MYLLLRECLHMFLLDAEIVYMNSEDYSIIRHEKGDGFQLENYVEMPQICYKKMIEEYMKKTAIIPKSIKNKLSTTQDSEYWHTFHVITEDYQLREDFENYYFEAILSVAIPWCEENGIAYSTKHLPVELPVDYDYKRPWVMP